MNNRQFDYKHNDEALPEISPEPSSRLASIGRRIILGLLALIVILSMLSNLLALPETVDSPSRSDLGLTEEQIIARYGEPDHRSEVTTVTAEGTIGLAPRRLREGEQYFSISYDQGPLTIIFHFVSPQTYQDYNAYRVEGEQWIVFERFIGTSNVIY
jgi:hypothetical protein